LSIYLAGCVSDPGAAHEFLRRMECAHQHARLVRGLNIRRLELAPVKTIEREIFSVNPQLNYILARQRTRELQRAGEQARLASELRTAKSEATRLPQHTHEPRVTGLTLHGHHVAKLDRFISQARRAALQAERDFEGVSIEVDAQDRIIVHAIGMTSMLL
jgi:hypothetical protein